MYHVRDPFSAPEIPAAKRNTVQLEAEDGCDGRMSGLKPGSVSGAFDVPLDVLAFDEPWV